MSVLQAVLLGLAMGLVFGVALEKSRVFEPGAIVGQMQMRRFIMLKVFLAAVATGLAVIAAMQGLGMTKLFPKATLYGADLVGGLLLGAGIVLAGACPGTVFAQLGAGYRDAWWTLLGGLAGALAFSLLEPTLAPMINAGSPGKLTLSAIWGVPYPVLAAAFAVLIVAGLVALERWRPWREEVGEAGDAMGEAAAPLARGRAPGVAD